MQHARLLGEHAFDEPRLPFVSQTNCRRRQVLVACFQRGTRALNERLNLLETYRRRVVVEAQLRAQGIIAIDVNTHDAMRGTNSVDEARNAGVTSSALVGKDQFEVKLVLLHAGPPASAMPLDSSSGGPPAAPSGGGSCSLR